MSKASWLTLPASLVKSSPCWTNAYRHSQQTQPGEGHNVALLLLFLLCLHAYQCHVYACMHVACQVPGCACGERWYIHVQADGDQRLQAAAPHHPCFPPWKRLGCEAGVQDVPA